MASVNQTRSTTYINKFGISFRQYMHLFRLQKGQCAICGTKALHNPKDTTTKLELVIDHCHVNHHIRGLLCNLCNTGLGMFKDNIEVLNNAITYLQTTIETPKCLQTKRVLKKLIRNQLPKPPSASELRRELLKNIIEQGLASVPITQEIIDLGKGQGGWSNRKLLLLGVPLPVQKDWQKMLLNSNTEISVEHLKLYFGFKK